MPARRRALAPVLSLALVSAGALTLGSALLLGAAPLHADPAPPAPLVAGQARAPAAPTAASRTLTLAGARAVLDAAVAAAASTAGTGAIAVVDEGGNLLALARLDGTFPASAPVATGKARTAALFRRPTAVFEETILKGRVTMIALDDFTPLRGGVPIVVESRVVGAVGVSGAASAEDDERIALAGAGAIAP